MVDPQITVSGGIVKISGLAPANLGAASIEELNAKYAELDARLKKLEPTAPGTTLPERCTITLEGGVLHFRLDQTFPENLNYAWFKNGVKIKDEIGNDWHHRTSTWVDFTLAFNFFSETYFGDARGPGLWHIEFYADDGSQQCRSNAYQNNEPAVP